MKAYGGIEVQLYASVSLPSGRNTGTHQIGGCVGPRFSVDAFKKKEISCLCWESNHDFSVISLIAYPLYDDAILDAAAGMVRYLT
jgi:hypothetical protein